MATLNKVFVIGRLTRDPELRYTPQGTAVCDIRLAVDDGRGEHKRTCFIDAVCWRKTAESVAEYLTKGSEVFVEGRLHLDEWTDQDSNKRSKIKITCERCQFMNRLNSKDDSADMEDHSIRDNSMGDYNNNDFSTGDDDIPF